MNAEPAGRGVAILGIGREGRSARRFLRRQQPDLPLTLLAETDPGDAFRQQLTPQDDLRIGPLSAAGLERFDLLVRSPGISLYRDSLRRAVRGGVRVTTPSNLWFEAHDRARTICITGTKGKSTTSALVAHLLRANGLRVQLAGNIGQALLDCDDEGVDWWVIELSSYQLADLDAEPGISVILNLSAEHLDWHGSEAIYRRDKLRLATLAGDRPLILNAADPVLRELSNEYPNISWFNSAAGIHSAEDRIQDGAADLGITVPESLPGAHNLENIAAALTVLKLVVSDMSAAVEALATFRGLPHRLQLLGEIDGVRYVNDSISSTPFATAAALEAFANEPTSLIIGGFDRGLDWSPYLDRIRACLPHCIIGVPDNGPRLIALLEDNGIEPAGGLHRADSLEKAVGLAQRLTPGGGLVLLSPGAPSFPQFRDFEDRGEQFARMSGFGGTESAVSAGN